MIKARLYIANKCVDQALKWVDKDQYRKALYWFIVGYLITPSDSPAKSALYREIGVVSIVIGRQICGSDPFENKG